MKVQLHSSWISPGLIAYTMRDINKATGDMCQLLGSGSIGTVYRGRLRSTDVAVKDCPMGEVSATSAIPYCMFAIRLTQLNMKAGDTFQRRLRFSAGNAPTVAFSRVVRPTTSVVSIRISMHTITQV